MLTPPQTSIQILKTRLMTLYWLPKVPSNCYDHWNPGRKQKQAEETNETCCQVRLIWNSGSKEKNKKINNWIIDKNSNSAKRIRWLFVTDKKMFFPLIWRHHVANGNILKIQKVIWKHLNIIRNSFTITMKSNLMM